MSSGQLLQKKFNPKPPANSMNRPSSLLQYSFSFFLLLFSIILASAQTSTGPPDPPPATAAHTNYRPSVAVVAGIFSIMISLTLLLLMYAKFCHCAAYELFSRDPNRRPGGLFTAPTNGSNQLHPRSFSGIDRTAIDSLPFFRFSSLKGSRHGLECAVCLSKFDDAELLRLLPKCSHAFHIDCVDRWLESHSTCPLCRHRIDPHDPNPFNFNDQASARHDDGEELEIELFVEREPDHNNGGDDNKTKKKKDELLSTTSEHKFKHRIIVSDVVFKSRWSDVNSSDLLSLSSDMLHLVSSRRFTQPSEQRLTGSEMVKIKDEMERERILESKARTSPNHFDTIQSFPSSSSATASTPSRSLISPGNRCMSEITNVSRFNGTKVVASSLAADEKVRRLWLPIARRTVQWFAGRESRGDSNV